MIGKHHRQGLWYIGSGTTAVACAENGRHCEGIDKLSDYLEIARKRVPGAKIVKNAAQ
jgi:site-specific DNA-methyltransferase (adenine-specific)